MSSITGSMLTNVFRANSLFDPDVSGVGTQPYYFDEYLGSDRIYQRYRVTACSIKVTVQPNSTSTVGVQNLRFGVYPTANSGTLSGTALETALQQAYCKHKWGAFVQSPSKDSTIIHYMTTDKIKGVRKASVLNDHDYTAFFSASPISPWYWHVFFFPEDRTSSCTANFAVELCYYAEMFERASPVASA